MDKQSLSKKVSPSEDGSSVFNTDVTSHNAKIDTDLSLAYKKATEILENNKKLFGEVVSLLRKDLFVDPQRFADLYNEYAVPVPGFTESRTCSVVSSEDELIQDFDRACDEFFKEKDKEECKEKPQQTPQFV